MYPKVLNSVTRKFSFVIMLGFVVLSVIFIYFFTIINSAQIEKERQIDKIKADKLIELISENSDIRQRLREYIERDIEYIIQNNLYKKDEQGNLIFPSDIINPKTWELANKTDTNQLKESFEIEYDIIKIRKRALEAGFRLVLWSGIVLLFSLILLHLAVKYFVSNKVNAIVRFSEKFAEGDMGARVFLKPFMKNPDELTKLALSFNKMANSLEKSLDEIRKKEHFLQALIDAIPDGVRVIDENYNIVVANKAYYSLIKQDVVPKGVVKCYVSSHKRQSPCQKSLVTCPLKELCNKDSIKAVQRFLTNENKEIPVEVNAACLINDEKQGRLIVESIRDLTKDIRFSHQQKLSSVGMLAAGIAHELRNPLGSVRLILEGISGKIETDKIKKEEVLKYLEKVTVQIVNCSKVTEILLKLSRLPSNELEEVNLSLAINEVKTLLDYESKKKGIEVIFKDSNQDVLISATESEIRMVLLNILQNAFNAMNNGGNVVVTLEQVEKQAKISIKDQGVGIEEENLPKIFDPFFSSRVKQEESGTGIGLTITKNMVERHNGKIFVESKKGEGTTFILDFPLLIKS